MSGRVVLCRGVWDSDAMCTGIVLWCGWAASSVWTVRGRVLLLECGRRDERKCAETGRELPGERAVSCRVLLRGGDGCATTVSTRHVFRTAEEQERVRLCGMHWWILLSSREHDGRRCVCLWTWLLLSSRHGKWSYTMYDWPFVSRQQRAAHTLQCWVLSGRDGEVFMQRVCGRVLLSGDSFSVGSQRYGGVSCRALLCSGLGIS